MRVLGTFSTILLLLGAVSLGQTAGSGSSNGAATGQSGQTTTGSQSASGTDTRTQSQGQTTGGDTTSRQGGVAGSAQSDAAAGAGQNNSRQSNTSQPTDTGSQPQQGTPAGSSQAGTPAGGSQTGTPTQSGSPTQPGTPTQAGDPEKTEAPVGGAQGTPAGGNQVGTPAPGTQGADTTQSGTAANGRPGRLTGRVTDERDQPVANAVIVVTDTATGQSQRVTTESDGTFTVSSLASGTYRMEVETSGRRLAAGQTVQISSGTASSVQVTFSDATSATGQQGTVEIKAQSPVIYTESGEVARQFGTRAVRELPILDRHYQELISLLPGVTPAVVSGTELENPQRSRTFNVNGTPSWSNRDFQDGAWNNEFSSNTVARVQPVESIQNTNVRTANYNAEYGFAGGSWTNNITRPGTNPVHGSLFYFNNNGFFSTRNPINPGNNPAPRFNQHQLGGTAGGAIVPSRAFWFVSYDGLLRRGRTLDFANVPSADFRAGNFASLGGANVIYNPASGSANGTGRLPFAGNQIPASQINPSALGLLNALPAANQPGSVNNLVGNVPLLNDQHRFDGKIDHRFTEKSTGFFRYGFTHGDLERGSILGVLGNGGRSLLRNHTAVASFTQEFNDGFFGDFRMGYTRFNNTIRPEFTGFGSQFNSASGSNLGTTGLTGQQYLQQQFPGGIPQISISGFSSFGQNFAPKSVNENYNPAMNFSLRQGFHNLRFGAEMNYIRNSGFQGGSFSPFGTFAFGPGATALSGGSNQNFNIAANSFASFLTGSAQTAGIGRFATTPNFRQVLTSGYITDTINLWRRVHLELGVRYDVFSRIWTRNNGGLTFYNAANNTTSISGGDSDQTRFGLQETDWNNFAPRIGIVVQPIERMVIRSSYAIQYFPTPFALLGFNPSIIGTQTGIAGGFGTTPFQLPTQSGTGIGSGTGSQPAGNIPLYATGNQSNPRTPYIHTYSLSVQGDVGYGFLLDVGYQGNVGRHLPFSRVLSASQPGTGLQGNAFFTQFNRTAPVIERDFGANSNYNALQVNLTKRMAAGLGFQASYTWSRAMDTGFDLLNPFNRGANYARADFDRRHILAISHVWNLPFGRQYGRGGWVGELIGNWELNGILRWATGSPYSVTADPLFSGAVGLSAVPASVNQAINIGGQTSFNPNLFSSPISGSFGNLGRNAITGPDLFTYNLGIFRNFAFNSNVKFELRGEVYNLTNSTNLGNPIAVLGAPGFGTSLTNFNGLGGRTFQVGGRFLF